MMTTVAGVEAHRGADLPPPIGSNMAPDLQVEVEDGVVSRDRRHGDPFPLPLLKNSDSFHPGLDKNSSSLGLHKRLVNEAVKSVNVLASATLNSRKSLKHDRSPCPGRGPTFVQQSMLADMQTRIRNFLDHEPTVSDEESLADMLGASHLYDQEASHLASFDASKIKIFTRKLRPMDASELCPPQVKQYIKHHQQFIERSSEDISRGLEESEPIRPYWDPKLRDNRSERIKLYQSLHDSGLLCFRRKRKSVIAYFTVKKKDGWQRLILDCRATNACHRPPPSTRLATPACFAGIDMTDESMLRAGFGGFMGEGGIQARGNEGDVGDCFYNFSIPSLASWFATKDQFTTFELDRYGMNPDFIYDDDLGVFARPTPGELLIPCFQGVPMGWSWALHIANEIVSYQVQLACENGDLQELKDKQCAPPLRLGGVLTGTYVDNVQVLGGRAEDVDRHMQLIVEWFAKLGIPFTTAGQAALEEFETLGMVFDMQSRCIRHRPKRAWRLYKATRALLKRGRIHGETLRIWLGHVVNHFQLMKPAMSCLHACYRFVQSALSRRTMVWPSVRIELRLVMGLVFLGQVDWSSKYNEEVYLGDSSTYGYSLMRTLAEPSEVQKAMKYEERWRFIEAEVDDLHADDTSSFSQVQGYHPNASLGMKTAFAQLMIERSQSRHQVKRWKKVRKDTWTKGSSHRELVEVPSLCKPLDKQWFRKDRYSLLVARRWKHIGEHINIKEGRVCLMGLRRHSRVSTCIGTRLLTLTDNMACLLAFSKGRSHSFALNQLVRRSAAYQLAGRIQWHLRHVPTKENASDESSRWHDPGGKWRDRHLTNPSNNMKKLSHETCKADHISVAVEPMKIDLQVSDFQDFFEYPARIHSMVSYLPLFVLELFSGSGRLTLRIEREGLAALDAFEIYNGWEFDLCRPQTQALVLELARAGLLWYIHAGLPCTVWSRARHGIRNFEKARAREAVAVELTMFVAALFRIQSRKGWYWSIENPATSRLFEFRPVVELFGLPHVIWFKWDMCAYGEAYKKPTGLLTNLAPLQVLARRCCGGHKHVQLVGREKYVTTSGTQKWRNKTSAAGECPLSLTRLWARTLAKECPYAARAPDSTGFKAAVRQRLQTIAGVNYSIPQSESAKNFPDLEPSTHPLRRANSYKQPIVFGQHTKKEAEWLRQQGA